MKDIEYQQLQNQLDELKAENGLLNKQLKTFKNQQDQLTEKLNLFDTLSQQLPGILYLFKVDSRGNFSIPYFSKSAEQVFEHDVALNKNPETMFNDLHPDDREMFYESVEQAISKKTEWKLEFRVLVKNKIKWLRGTSKPISHADGSLVYSGILLEITREKQLQSDINETTRNYYDLFEANFDGITIFEFDKNDQPSTIVEMNTSAAQMLGYTREELIKTRPSDIEQSVAEDDYIKRIESIKSKGVYWFQTHLKHKKGHWVPVEIYVKLIEYNCKPALMNITRDITEREQAAQKLESIRENYESFFNTIDEFLFVLDEQRKIVHTNQTVNDRLGYGDDELKGQSVVMVHPQQRREEAATVVQQILKGEAEYCMVPLITKSGQEIQVETRVNFGVWNGKPAIFGITKDITQLKESEEKFSKSFYLNPAACSLSDIESGVYLELNNAFYNIFGFTKEESLGHSAIEIGIMDELTRNEVHSKLDANGKCENIEVQLKHKNGDERYVLLSAENIWIQNKQLRYTVASDITRHKQTELLNRLRIDFLAFADKNPLDRLLQRVIDKICERFNSPIGFFHFVSSNQNSISLQQWSTHTKEEFCNIPELNLHYSIDKAGVWADCIKTKKPIIHNDYSSLKYKKGLPEGHVGIIREMVIPVIINQKVMAIVGVGNKPVAYTAEEAEIGTQIAEFAWDIIEKKRAEEELQQSEKKYRNLFENAQEGFFQTNPDGQFLTVNPAFVKLLGYDSVDDFFKERNKQMIQKYFDKSVEESFFKELAQKGFVKGFEFQICNKNGEFVWLSEDAKAILDTNGEIIYYEGFIADITQRKQAETLANESLAQKNALIMAIPDMIFYINKNLVVIDYYAPDHALLIMPPELFVGKKITNVFTPELNSQALEKIKEVLNKKQLQTFEYQLTLKNREEWFEARMVPVENKGLMIIVRQITQSKQAELALKESEARFKAFMKHTPVFAYIKDAKLNSIYKNKPASIVLRKGLPKNFKSNNGHYFSNTVIEMLEKADREILSKNKDLLELVFNAPVNEKDAWIKELKFPLTMPNGEIAVGGIAMDITEQKLAEKSLVEQQEQQQAMLENITDVIEVIDQNQNIKYISPNIEQWFGWQVQELVNKKAFQNIAKESIADLFNLVHKLENNPDLFGEVELLYICKDKSKKWVNLKANNQLHNPHIKGILLNFHDISERKQNELELKKAKEIAKANEFKVRSMFENSLTGYMYFTPKGKILEMNQAVHLLMGAPSREETLKIDLLNFPLLKAVGFSEDIIRCIKEKRVITETKLYQTKWGKTVYMQYFLIPLINNDSVEGIWANLNDLTDLWEVQQDLLEVKHQAEESERKYRLIAENTSDGILVTDANNQIVYESPAYLKIMGRESQKGLQINQEFTYNFLHPEDREETFKKIIQAIKNNAESLIYAYRVLHAKGYYFWREDHARFKYNEKGEHIETYIMCRDISYRKNAELQIQEQLKQYNALLSTTSDGYFMIDMLGNFLDTNENLCQLTGYSKDELLAMNLEKIEGSENREEVQLHMEKIMNAGLDVFESKLRTKDGRLVDVEVSASYWEEKKYIFSFIRDIREKKEAELQIKESEKRLLKAQNIARIGDWEFDMNTRQATASEEARRIYGISQEGIFSMKYVQDVVLSKYREKLDKALKDLVEHNKPYDVEFEIQQMNSKKIRHIHSKAELIKDESKNIIKVAVVIQDITTQKELENELRKLGNAIEQSPSSILITDLKGNIEYVNPEFTKVSGYSFMEVLGKNPRIIKSDQNAPGVYQELWNTIAKGNTWKGELCNKRKNGSFYWEEVTIAPVRNSTGDIINYIAIKEDITDKKETDRKLLKATIKGEEQERNRFSRELHDGLGPLLSTIKLYFQWISETDSNQKKQLLLQNGNKNIEEAIATLREISNNLSPRALSSFGLVIALENFIANFKQGEHIDIKFSTDLDQRLVKEVEINLYRIIMELLNNSIKHAQAKEIAIDLRYNKSTRVVHLDYVDDGIGFANNPLGQTEKGRGLANISNRVESYKGTITIESEPNKGFKARIEFPDSYDDQV